MEYWKKQGKDALFSEIEWNRPENRLKAGRVVIIGGNSGAFRAGILAAEVAGQMGVGEVRVLLPESLKKTVPKIEEVSFIEGGAGGFGARSEEALRAARETADASVLMGDLGKNAETTVVINKIAKEAGKMVAGRDAVEMLMSEMTELVTRDDIVFFTTFAQLQKIFRAVLYPKVLLMSINLMQAVEALHKFTLTYPTTIVTTHSETYLVAHGGEVVTTKLIDLGRTMLSVHSGEVMARGACFWAWNPGKPLESFATAAVKQ